MPISRPFATWPSSSASSARSRDLTTPAFELRGAGAEFDSARVLDGLDLVIDAGAQVAVVGPSGSGKTTLLRLLGGTVRPAGGSARSHGDDLALLSRSDLRKARARIGFVHQDHSLVPTLRVSQNVIAGRLGQRDFLSAVRSMTAPKSGDVERAFSLLERVGIPEKLYERTDTLSGGQQQRVALARALFQEPAALLADEPVASVDPARARDLIQLMIDVSTEDDLTLVAALHDLSIAREFFPRCIGMRAGRIVFDRSTAEVSPEDWDDLYRLEPTNGD